MAEKRESLGGRRADASQETDIEEEETMVGGSGEELSTVDRREQIAADGDDREVGREEREDEGALLGCRERREEDNIVVEGEDRGAERGGERARRVEEDSERALGGEEGHVADRDRRGLSIDGEGDKVVVKDHLVRG